MGDLLFCSGSLGLDPSVGKMVCCVYASGMVPILIVSLLQVEGGVEAQAEQALKNLKAVVEAGGSELGKVVKTTVCFVFELNVELY